MLLSIVACVVFVIFADLDVIGLAVAGEILRCGILRGEPIPERVAGRGPVRGGLNELLLGKLEALGLTLAALADGLLGRVQILGRRVATDRSGLLGGRLGLLDGRGLAGGPA